MELSKIGPPPASADPLRVAAQKLETQFISEMLKSAGVGDARSEFGGGAGEDQFASFLRDAQAERIVAAGGFGLSAAIYASLMERSDV